jgi:flagellar basal body-associated protein FliL
MMHRFGMNDTDEDSGMSGGQILLWILVGIVAAGLLAAIIVLCACSGSAPRKRKSPSEKAKAEKASEKSSNKDKKEEAPPADAPAADAPAEDAPAENS